MSRIIVRLTWLTVASLLLAACGGSSQGSGPAQGVPPPSSPSGTVWPALVSADPHGQPAQYDAQDISIGETGRYVVFDSAAPNLSSANAAGSMETYIRDTCIGAGSGCLPSTQIVSVANDGIIANGGYGSGYVGFSGTGTAMSRDGRWVAFTSAATNLGVTTSIAQIYLRDTCLGAPAGCIPTTTLISIDGNGNPSGGVSPQLSADGRYLTYLQSQAIVLVDTCHGADASCSPGTSVVYNGVSDYPWPGYALSGDATEAAYDPAGSGAAEIYELPTCIGPASGCNATPILVSTASNGSPAGADTPGLAPEAALNASGRFVAFADAASNLAAAANGKSQVYVHDACLGASGCTPNTWLVSLNGSGGPGNDNSESPSISQDGSLLAYDSSANNLAGTVPPYTSQIYVSQSCAGVFSCIPHALMISTDAAGGPGEGFSSNAHISGDGHYVAFCTTASNLAPGTDQAVQVVVVPTGF